MSIYAPIYGIDISGHQRADIDVSQLWREGYEFIWIKATEGDWFTNDRFDQQMERVVRHGRMLPGAYHFLYRGNIERQLDKFLRVVGNKGRGKVLAVDVESYATLPARLHPRYEDVSAFVKGLRARVGKRPVVVYSSNWYWRDALGNPGLIGLQQNHGVRVWGSLYVSGDNLGQWGYGKVPLGWWSAAQSFGRVKPHLIQFTDKGRAANLDPVDINAWAGTRSALRDLAPGRSLLPYTPPVEGAKWPGDQGRWRWGEPQKKLVAEIERNFPVHCYSYKNHGMPLPNEGQWGIDIPVAPLGQRADRAQEALGDRIQAYIEQRWKSGLRFQYLIWWGYWKRSVNGSWEVYDEDWPHGSRDEDTFYHFDHDHLQTDTDFVYRSP